jgi:DNA invertase Pin-like site-specific DNA recombinase
MLTVLGGLAEFERSLIKARCDTGIARARAAGVKFGRKPKLSAYQRQEAIARREGGEAQGAIAARMALIRRPYRDFEQASRATTTGLSPRARGGVQFAVSSSYPASGANKSPQLI